jgi:glutathione S-transferase
MPALILVSHHLCPYVQRAAIALTEKAVPFERINIDLAAKPAWFLAQSPLGKTPLLKVGDDVVFESAVICEYLEDTQSHPLHPADPLARARHRGWIETSSVILGDIWALETATDAATVERQAADLRRRFAIVEAALGDGPYFAGATFTLVDAAFGPVFRYFDVFDQLADLGVFTATPKVRAWRTALAQRPSIRGAVTADYNERLLAFLSAQNAYLLTGLHRNDTVP